MTDHQSTSGSRASQSITRLGGEFPPGRSPPGSMTLEDSATAQNAPLGPGIGNAAWRIWGGGIKNITPIKGGNENSKYLGASSSFDQAQGPTSRIPTEYERPWPSTSTMTWPEEPTPALPNVQLGETLNRSPIRLRNDPPQAAPDIPRSSSPYPNFTRQAPVGQPSMGQSPSNNNNTRGFLDSTSGFAGGIGGGTLNQAFAANNNRLSSESGYGQYPTIPAQQPTAHPPIQAPPFVPSYQSTRAPARYDDLIHDTTKAEVLAAQYRKMAVETDDQDRYNAANRRNNPTSFSQASANNTLPSFPFNQQPQFGDFPYTRQSMPAIPPGPNPWSGVDESNYNGEQYINDGSFQEGYGDHQMMIYDHNPAKTMTAEVQSRNQSNTYFLNGSTSSPGMELRPSSRSGVSVQSHQQGHLGPAPMMLPRDQAFARSPYPVPFQYPYNGLPHYQASTLPSMLPSPTVRRQDDTFTHNLRSVLLEEFRSNSKSNKRFELKDIYTHVVEFSGDQHGSRFIQQKLETANSDEKEIVFNEIFANSLPLMTDVFGNYVIQKFFEHGNQVQKSLLAKQMEGHVLTLSLQMYGCRVVQKALEHILVDQQAALVKELDGNVLKCVKDQNGNHVVQKAIERVPAEHIQFIIKAFTGQVHSLATHPYGCRVIQRMLEHCDEKVQATLLAELHVCTYTLVQDQYGNYVTQHVIEHGKPEDRAKIIQLVTTQLLHFSKHKFASNVVEKSIAHGTDEQRREIVKVITTLRPDGSSPLQVLMRDQYGNYVIQKLLIQLKDKDREVLVDQIKPQLLALKKYHFGKQINAIEKLIYNSTPPQSQSATPSPTQPPSTPPPPAKVAQSVKASSSASTPSKVTDNSGPADTKNTKPSGA